MSAVLNIDDFRAPKIKDGGSARVTFIAHPFRDENGRNIYLTKSFNCDDYEGAIKTIREDGGFWVRDEEKTGGWFFPWPPAAIEVRPA